MHGAHAIARFSPLAVLGALRWADCLILGGGSLIQDSTSTRSALYYIYMMRLARALGAKVFLWAQGFGPLEAPGVRSAAARALRGAVVTCRDQESLAEFAELGVPSTSLHLSADPAFLLEPEDLPADQDYFSLQTLGRGVLGAALRDWPGMDEAQLAVAAGLAGSSETSGLSLLFIPFQQPQDLAVSQKIADRADVPSAVLNIRPTPGQMVRIFQELKAGCAMRLHAAILSAAAGVPFAGISYDPKVQRFCESAGMPWLPLEQLEAEQLAETLIQVIEDSAAPGRLTSFAATQKEMARQSARLFWEFASG